MPTNTATAANSKPKHGHRKEKEPKEKKSHKEKRSKERKSHKEKNSKDKKGAKAKAEFKASGVIEGWVPVNPNDEVDIQGAREVFEMRSQKSLGKPYKVKVMGTDTQLIIKRGSRGLGPKEMTLYCNEVHRFFIFVRDPKLVILVLPDDCPSRKAYVLLKMKTDADANRVCNVIQNGRKKLNAQASQGMDPNTPINKTATENVRSEPPIQEMQESRNESARPVHYTDMSSTSSSSDSDSEYSLRPTVAAMRTPTPPPKQRSKSPERASPRREEPIQQVERQNVYSGYHEKSNYSSSRSSSPATPRSLPRKALYEESPKKSSKQKEQKTKRSSSQRREAPHIEEMYVEPPKNWKVAEPIYARREEELRQVLRADRYDDEWAVDVKLIETDGQFGSRLSENGNVYMFTAHHLVPENYSQFDCSSSSDDEVVLKEKPRHYRHLSSSSSSPSPSRSRGTRNGRY